MPLDTGDIAVEADVRATGDDLATLRPGTVTLATEGHVGQALAAARRSLGLDIEDVASATCVRRRYIQAIEDFEFDALPSRPFVIGYIRAYARALGLAHEPVIERFKAEAPASDDGLRAPIALEPQAPWARRLVIAVSSVVVVAVGAWNVWRHAEAQPLRAPSAVRIAAAPPPAGPLELGAPPPTPPEASTPAPYQTPGLAAADAPPATPAIQPGAAFAPAGAIYGAPAPGAGLILQARGSTSLIVRDGSGAIVFARQLAAGEAWRAPALTGLTVEAASPASVDVFVGGVSKGAMSAPKAALATLAG